MAEAEFTPETSAMARMETFYFENVTEVFSIKMALKNMGFRKRSPFQLVEVMETYQFGKTLVMDGQTQSAAADEHVYHESLVHPAMLIANEPKSVFIGGGGEFASAREVLRHRSVERCVMVDLDKVACDVCREQLPEWNAYRPEWGVETKHRVTGEPLELDGTNGAFEDARFEAYYEDAYAWLETNEDKFDVIIMDICDPIEAGPGYKLYTKEFYTFVQSRLNPGGVLVTQSGPGSVYNVKSECFTVIHATLKAAFDVVVPYSTDVPSFGCNWGFNLALNVTDAHACDGDATKLAVSIRDKPVELVDEQIAARMWGENRFLAGVAQRGIMGLPKSVREECAAETRVMTIDNPVFMYTGH